MGRRISENEFIRAYDELADDIFRFCAFQVRDRERARELMQDAFMRTWMYLEAGNEIENLKAFLYKTARNLSINEAVRSKARSLEELQENVGYDPADEESSTPQDAAEASILLQHLSALSEDAQEVLTLRYMNGLAVKEIGEILGAAPNTISVRIHRALEELRKRMHA
ncbi:MAG TPA: RNA polymerase sigma factor [Candidatus Paceibacterota bacterium]|nr:RNA polymerase sigma factor [Candidatus Paceibacterota bacterium]